ncbi:hypothetical protein BZG36_01900 [Bifiguratus adelaidae]|uniref:Cap-specific mRNA (nucleoside-2'-O-)-methyltransferase 1 n=1 Tax=Bifiguratus adelaidae TaxID=1938954 RepID=A0A261Y4F6_9FUNG|nr:hypothetical protein BZG36_01900 [Bifiguratus adelaidae]
MTRRSKKRRRATSLEDPESTPHSTSKVTNARCLLSEELLPRNSKSGLDIRFVSHYVSCSVKNRLNFAQFSKHLGASTEAIKIDKEWYNTICDVAVIENLDKAKAALSDGDISHELFTQSRSRSSVFDAVGRRTGFLNRAAIKMACLDNAFSLTSHTLRMGSFNDKIFSFVDICGGPGGFSEYLIWRIRSGGGDAKGWGVTLAGDEATNWRTQTFREESKEGLEIFNGGDQTGDIYKKMNRDDFVNQIMKATNGEGVRCAVADGGFDFTGYEKDQEMASRRIILDQSSVILRCLGKGGNFALKFFDTFHPFTLSTIYVFYQLFESLCLCKIPVSRPGNSERYLIGKNFMHSVDASVEEVRALLQRVFDEADERLSNEGDIYSDVSILSQSVVVGDSEFCEYIKHQNLRIATEQTEALREIRWYIEHPEIPARQEQMQVKRKCFGEWHLPWPDGR